MARNGAKRNLGTAFDPPQCLFIHLIRLGTEVDLQWRNSHQRNLTDALTYGLPSEMLNPHRSKGFKFLLALVAASALARALVIWIFRPEFAGWFNHTYYYFVQVRGILEKGSMPYSDLPLLFYFYASAARGLMFLGFSAETSIVNSTRLLMSIVPALTAVPVFFLLRSMRSGERMKLGDKLLVAAAAFLPLNLVHMPELLQKNSFGIFLFACLLLAVFKALQEFSILRGASIALLLALIGASHFGTLAAVLLFALSLAIASIVVNGVTRISIALVVAGIIAGAVSAGVILIAVPERFGRIMSYAGGNFSNSLVGRLLSEGTAVERLQYLAAVILPLAFVVWVVYALRKRTRHLPAFERTFLFANLLLIYLFAAPFIDTALIPRFLLFVPLPAIVLSAYVLEYAGSRIVRAIPAALLVGASVLMTFGETMSVVMTNGSNRETQSELGRLRESGIVSEDDLIVTTYGINPICNWFLGTKASLITEFKKEDLERYQTVFVLESDSVPRDTRAVDEDGDGLLSDSERYFATRRQIELPDGAVPVFRSETFELYKLETVPENWKFEEDGGWIGYR